MEDNLKERIGGRNYAAPMPDGMLPKAANDGQISSEIPIGFPLFAVPGCARIARSPFKKAAAFVSAKEANFQIDSVLIKRKQFTGIDA